MTLLYTMSLAGSIAIGIYLCTSFLTKRYLPITWHKIYLTVNIILFLVPFGCFKAAYTAWLNRYLGLKAWYQETRVVRNMTNYTIFVYQDGVYVSNLPVYIILLFSLLLGIGGLILYVKKYFTVYLNFKKEVVLYENGKTVLEELERKSKRNAKKKYIYVPASNHQLQSESYIERLSFPISSGRKRNYAMYCVMNWCI